MNRITKIWFDEQWLWGLGDDGKTYRQSLLWYPKLMAADSMQRSKYETSTIGFHWRELDEDVSFESFLYEDAEPTYLQRIFLTHPEINVSAFARKYGFNASLLRNYINGFKKPSQDMEYKILSCLKQLGSEISMIS
ncbi:MAG: DUF2442 domain-containing protein [Bacteroidales bacterium]|nr:DUF2442 domain-containing protein [Bacteroidales bacterium]